MKGLNLFACCELEYFLYYRYTANKNPGGSKVNYTYPFYLSTPCTFRRATLQRKSHLCIPFLGIARPQSQFPHSCVCERFIYIYPGLVQLCGCSKIDRSWKYINLSQIYECRNCETEHYNSVLEIRRLHSFICSALYSV
jgi:hypothetical protein